MAVKESDADTTETLREEISQLRADMAAIAGTLKNMGAEGGSKVYERLRESAERTKGEAEHAAATAGRRIEENPFTAMVTAFILGAILGALIGRR